MKLSLDEKRVLLRSDFYGFAQFCFNELNPGTAFVHGAYLELMAHALEECRRRGIKRLIINIPPRSMKSIYASVALPAWLLGHNPAERIICASYSNDLSGKMAADTKRVMQSAFYRAVFPNTIISPNRQQTFDFETTLGGGRLGTSTGGVLTGRGANFIILDDILKPAEALSDVVRKKCNDWYSHTLLSRLDDRENGVIIIVMQRLHMDDIVGHVLQEEGWTLLKLPLIAVEDEVIEVKTPWGPYRFTRKAGELLHPERISMEEVLRIRHQIGDYHFAGQYQQEPVPLEGAMVLRDWLRYYDEGELPRTNFQIVQSWDTASKETELADYSVCTTWLVHRNRYYLIDVLRRKMNFPTLKRTVLQHAGQFQASVVLIEDKASGIQLLQELRDSGFYQCKGITPLDDKVMRMHAQTPIFENGAVLLPRNAPWLPDYVSELTSFPGARHDDQVDSTTQALEWCQTEMWKGGRGLLKFAMDEMEAAQQKDQVQTFDD